MTKKKIIKKVEELEEINSDEEEIEIKPKKLNKIKNILPNYSDDEEDNKIEKPKRKTNYVLTDARKKAFELAIIKRNENIQLRKQLREAENNKLIKLKEELKNKQIKKINKIKKQVEEISESEEEEIIIKRKKKPKKKIIIQEESESESEIEDKIIKTKKEKPINVTVNNITQPIQQQPTRRINNRNLPSGFV